MSSQADQSFGGDVSASTLQGRDKVSVGNTPLVTGTGVPAFNAAQGALFLRTDVAELYQNTNGAGTWALVGGGGGSYPDITDTAGVQVAIGVQTQLVAPTGYVPLVLDAGVSTSGAGGTIAAIGDTSVNGNPLQVRSAVNVHPVTGVPISGQGADVDVALVSQLVLRGNHQAVGASGTFNNVAVFDGSASFNAQGGGAGGLLFTGMEPPLAWFAMTGPTFSPNFIFFLANNGSGDLTIKHNDAGSLEYHRFYLPGSANIVIPASGGVVLRWGFSALAVGFSLGWTLVAKGI